MGQRKNSRHAIFDLQLEDDRPGKHYSLEPQFRRQWVEKAMYLHCRQISLVKLVLLLPASRLLTSKPLQVLSE